MKANEYVDRLRKRIKDLEQKVDQLSGDYERWSENEIARLRAEVEELRFKVSQLISKILGPYGSPLSPTTETGDTPLEISRRDDGE